jgi:hypothetical protein
MLKQHQPTGSAIAGSNVPATASKQNGLGNNGTSHLELN